MAKDITLLEEISDLDLDQVNGSGHGGGGFSGGGSTGGGNGESDGRGDRDEEQDPRDSRLNAHGLGGAVPAGQRIEDRAAQHHQRRQQDGGDDDQGDGIPSDAGK